MRTTIELTDQQLDEVIRLALISQYEDCNTGHTSDWFMYADYEYDRKMRKALKKVIKHNSTPGQWAEFKEIFDV